MISDKEIERMALQQFKRLADPGACLQLLSTHLSKNKGWGVFVARNGYGKPVAHLSCEIVDGFAARDWIVCEGSSRAILSAAGRSWYKRKTATGDPYGAQHQERVTVRVDDAADATVRATVNQKESPLSWLRSRRDAQGKALLSDEQFKAGERLRRDFELAQLQPHITASWDHGVSPKRRSQGAAKAVDISETALAAKQRFHRAIDAVGPELASVLIEVCCFLSGVAGAEQTLGWPKRSGKVVLLIALNALARHYGLMQAPRSSRSGLRHWAADDYRPSI